MKHHTYRIIDHEGEVIGSFICDEDKSDDIYDHLVKLQCLSVPFRFTRASGILTDK